MASLAPAAEKVPAGKPLKVGSAHDPAEREADRIADLLTAPEEPALPVCAACAAGGAPCPACGGDVGGVLRRKVLGGESGSGGGMVAPPSVHRVLSEPGEALPSGIQGKFERKLDPAVQIIGIAGLAASSLSPVQTKLKVGEPGDLYEQEADWVADQVMRMPEPWVQRSFPEYEEELQRHPKKVKEEAEKSEKNEMPKKESPYDLTIAPIQRKADLTEDKEKNNEETQQSITTAGGPPTALNTLQNLISELGGAGKPLPRPVKNFFERRFGTDFAQVRIHSNSKAAEVAGAVNARAFTLSRDVVFGAGQYQPNSANGQHLLAHELAHVVQQTGAVDPTPGRMKTSKEASDPSNIDNIRHERTGARLQRGQEAGYDPAQIMQIHEFEIQRQVAGQSGLEKLREMLDKFDIPESQVINLLPNLTPQEKMVVITDAWYKKRMVEALDFGEMVRAMANLNPSLYVKLNWLNEAAITTRAIEYSDIKLIIVNAPISERKALSSQYWRDFFLSVCTNATIIEAVIDLRLPLSTQLEWISAEVTSVGASISYSDIQQLIQVAPQAERDALKTIAWRDYFIKVCNNETIITAVKDFGFDRLTRIDWILEEGNASAIWALGGIEPTQAYDALKSCSFDDEALLLIELANLNGWKLEDIKRIRQLMDTKGDNREKKYKDELGENAKPLNSTAEILIEKHTKVAPRGVLYLNSNELATELSTMLLTNPALVRQVLDILTTASQPHLIDKDDDVAVLTLEAIADDQFLKKVAEKEDGRSLLLTIVKKLFKGVNLFDEERQQTRVMQIISDFNPPTRAENNATTEVEVITFLYGSPYLDKAGEELGHFRGHTALVVGGLVYSFEEGWSCGYTKASYLAKDINVIRDGIGQILELTEEDAKELQTSLNQACGTGVYTIPDICTGKVSIALGKALSQNLQEVENPQLFVSYLEATGLVKSRKFYPRKK
jgi:hypothetical protein